MKIMLHGFLSGANFGDMLSAELFYKRCQKAGFDQVDFFQDNGIGIGDFCRKQIGYNTEKNILSCFGADAFVIISGGSFWNTHTRQNDAKTRYRHFILPALIYQFLGKPVYVLGVGGGMVDSVWLRKKMVRLLNRAKVITFRDKQTRTVFLDYGVKNQMTVTADTLLVLKPDMLDSFEEKDKLERIANGRKKLLLHVPTGAWPNSYVADIVMPAIILFLENHSEYMLVLSDGDITPRGDKEQAYREKTRNELVEAGIDFYDYQYHDSWQMCSLINEMDCVITLHLHVGVVAAAFGKSVISFPVHKDKTENFYEMIGESERCFYVKNLDIKSAYKQMEHFHDKPVHISDDSRARAEKNLLVIDNIRYGN